MGNPALFTGHFPPRPVTLRRVCCQCRYIIGADQMPTVPSGSPTDRDTHGYCAPCLEAFADKLEELDAN